MKRWAFQRGAGDLVTRRPEMQDHCYPPSCLTNRSITPPHVSTVDDNAASARRLATLPLPRPFADLHYNWIVRGRGLGAAQIALQPDQ
jgi:hypothetical protein